MTMKLHHTASPYVRKVDVCAIEAGLDDEIERIAPTASVWAGESDPDLIASNPLGKVPALSGWYDGFAERASMRATVPPRVPPPHLDPRRG